MTEPHEHDFAPHPDFPLSWQCTADDCDVLTGFRPNHHPHRVLRTPGGCLAEIDEDVCDLVQTLWAKGAETLYSCQGGCTPGPEGVGMAYLSYRSHDHDVIAEIFAGRDGLRWEQERSDGVRTVRWPADRPCPRRAAEDAGEQLMEVLRDAHAEVAITTAEGVSVRRVGSDAVWVEAVEELREKLGIAPRM